ncbi:MAG: hypothetical protein HW394_1751 [Acidobacteria bacterium]|nr:hypothetical protein [Acidobacteriota bacterium]
MRHRFFGVVLLAAIAAVALYSGGTRVAGQEAQRAKTEASATVTPRMSDGRPDLNGYWYRRRAPIPTVRRSGASVILDPTVRDPSAPSGNDAALLPGTPKYKPEFLAKVKQLDENQVNQDPAFTCGPPGVPRIGPPQRIVQTAREVVLLYDDLNGNFFRFIPTDGRPHRTGIEASAHGDSIGRWEADTLVIDVRNLSAETWLGDNGLFHTEDVRVTERLRREGNTLTWQATVEDPAVLAEPWKVNPRTLTLRTADEIEEAAFCQDRIQPYMQDLSHHRNTR